MNPSIQLVLQKTASFVKLAIEETEELQAQVDALRQREAAYLIERQQTQKLAEENRYSQLVSISKAAEALYNSDFITDDYERKLFVKKAQDPAYLASVIEKICKAADVSRIGSPARVAAKVGGVDEDDPVKRRMYGIDGTSFARSNILLEETE